MMFGEAKGEIFFTYALVYEDSLTQYKTCKQVVGLLLCLPIWVEMFGIIAMCHFKKS